MKLVQLGVRQLNSHFFYPLLPRLYLHLSHPSHSFPPLLPPPFLLAGAELQSVPLLARSPSTNRKYPPLPVDKLEEEMNRRMADDNKLFREEFNVWHTKHAPSDRKYWTLKLYLSRQNKSQPGACRPGRISATSGFAERLWKNSDNDYIYMIYIYTYVCLRRK